jgi:hypothetical protein
MAVAQRRAASKLVQRQHCVIAPMKGIVHRQSIADRAARTQCPVVSDRDRFVVRDWETMERAFERRPGWRTCRGTAPLHVAAVIVPARIGTLYNRDKLRYPSDLTGAGWQHIEPLISPFKGGSGSDWLIHEMG